MIRNRLLKIIFISIVLLAIWQLLIIVFDLPHYILASPIRVFITLAEQYTLLFHHAKVTLIEIILGLLLGLSFGLLSATSLVLSKKVATILMPIMVLSQAIPIFAIAPLLVLWFGYGMASKVIMAGLMLYFPVTAACYDGLRNTPKQWVDIAISMQASPWAMFKHVYFPASLPALASGVRIATSFAPIGAIIGEWVGGSQGLGYIMLQANARMQIDMVFAALIILISVSLTLYFSTDLLLKRLIPWQDKLH